jgi:hypothetical protein
MPQVEAHCALLDVVARLDPAESEPAGEFRLSRQEGNHG